MSGQQTGVAPRSGVVATEERHQHDAWSLVEARLSRACRQRSRSLDTGPEPKNRVRVLADLKEFVARLNCFVAQAAAVDTRRRERLRTVIVHLENFFVQTLAECVDRFELVLTKTLVLEVWSSTLKDAIPGFHRALFF